MYGYGMITAPQLWEEVPPQSAPLTSLWHGDTGGFSVSSFLAPFSFPFGIPWVFSFKSRLVPDSAQSSTAQAVSYGTGRKRWLGSNWPQELL